MDKCRGCSEPIKPKTYRGNPKVWCSEACRQTHWRRSLGMKPKSWRPPLTCARCGDQMRRGSGSLPQGQAICRDCRNASPSTRKSPKSPCVDCESPSYGNRCRPCADAAKVTAPKRIRSLDDARVRRLQREMAAPGLTRTQRTALLRQWKRQARRCTYCPALATTVDHVVPLVRGGTNHEGNLTPCCRPCNGRKAGLMVSEWRHGKRLPPMTEPLAWRFPPPDRPKRRRLKFGAQRPLFTLAEAGLQATRRRICKACGTRFRAHSAADYCSDACRPARAKTHCKLGHEMTPENTRVRTSGSRQCRKCRAAERKTWKAKRATTDPIGAGVNTAA